ncbi:NRDE family protein [Nocardia panacis]|uniref:NRDE family protein n=1 Tax=Nocardia panacis TaxID=2340916 RepID=A0A3A4KQB6_9NOCA|nr:NRDE family protein [Nocardia panacis]RJO76762.1 NRDE family protein [Nocardia panacis]
MCLVLVGWRVHPEYRLIVAANRDEFYRRPAESLRGWPEVPGLLAGRDLGAADRAEADPPGTWLGLRRETQGRNRFAAVTNVRDPKDERADAHSRGTLLMNFLRGDGEFPSPEKYLLDIADGPDDYNGYNLMVSDLDTLWWHTNRGTGRPQELFPGFHGLANGSAVASAGPNPGDAEITASQPVWPKVRSGLTALRTVVGTEPAAMDRYFALLSDRTRAPDEQLPNTGVGLARERGLSARFIADIAHGTRVSTVLLVRTDGSFTMAERTFGRFGKPRGAREVAGALDLPAAQ